MAERERIVVLLRAVNLGATNKVPMARLREVATELGATDVSTYIASGNLFCRPPGKAQEFVLEVEDAIKREFDVSTRAIARTGAQLLKARAAFPFDVHAPKLCAIWFLERQPTPAAAAGLSALDVSPDQCAVVGPDLHIRYDDGIRNSKLSVARVERTLGVQGTARNLATVEALAKLLSKASA